MAQLLSLRQISPPNLTRRFGAHCLAVAIVGVALVGATVTRPAATGQAASDIAPGAAGGSGGPTALSLAALPVTPAPTAAPAATVAPTAAPGVQPTQGTAQQQPAAFDPRLGLPRWLQLVHDAQLWSSADASATSSGSLPAGSTFVKPLGPFGDTRVQVYFPGDDSHAAAQAWVDNAAVEPSGIPTWIDPPLQGQTPPGGSTLPASPQRTGDGPVPDTTAIHIAIIDDASGQLIYGEQPYTEVAQASTTKIATTIVALERSPDLSQRIPVTISASAMVAKDGSSTMGIEPGQTVTLDTLLHGMMLPSGNDAAEQVAVSLGGTRDQYIAWMNDEVAALGLKDTHFMNPSGMDADGHYSSAYDMAMLARYAMHNTTFRDLASTMSWSGDGFRMQNLNRLLGVYPGADGVKIGFTDAAQKTFVASVVHNGHRVYVSLMHSEDLPGDSEALFNWVWDNFTWQ
jgi:hypothetical protein